MRLGSCSLCKQELVGALCAFHGDKVSGAEPQSNGCAAAPTHPVGGGLGWSLEDGQRWGAGTRTELQGWSWSSQAGSGIRWEENIDVPFLFLNLKFGVCRRICGFLNVFQAPEFAC